VAYNFASSLGGGIACASVVTLSNVSGLSTNTVGAARDLDTAAVSCRAVSCSIVTANMAPLNGSCCYSGAVMYVTSTGQDFPFCGNPSSPCASIQYAAQHAIARPIVVQLPPGSLNGSNCVTAGPFPDAVEVRGDPSGTSALACSGASGAVLSLYSGELPSTAWFHDFAIILGARSYVQIQDSSPRFSNVTFTSVSTFSAPDDALIRFTNSSALLQSITVVNFTVVNGLTVPIMQASCSTPSCNSILDLQNSSFVGNSGIALLSVTDGAAVVCSNVNWASNSARSSVVPEPNLAPVMCSNGGSLALTGGQAFGNSGVCGGVFLTHLCSMTATGLLLVGNDAVAQGGVACVQGGTFSVSHSAFIDNSALSFGGAVASTLPGGMSSFTNCTFQNNSAASGGAFSVYGGLVRLVGSVTSANWAQSGGAVFLSGMSSSFVTVSTNISANRAVGLGGAAVIADGAQMWLTVGSTIERHTSGENGAIDIAAGGSLVCSDSIIRENSAAASGAAIVVVGGNVTAVRCSLSQNVAGAAGGAVFATQSVVSLVNSVIRACSAHFGGGIYLSESTLTLAGTIMLGNSAPDAGGALMAINSQVVLVDSTLRNNSATDGGAVFSVVSSLSLERAQFDSNVAVSNGAALNLVLGSLSANGSVFTSNRAVTGAAVAAQSLVSLVFANCSFIGNSAFVGGALDAIDQRGDFLVQQCMFANNSAVTLGGAMNLGTSVSASLVALNTTWMGNQAPQGSAIVSNAPLRLLACSVRRNVAIMNGSAIWIAPVTQSQVVISDLTGTDFDFNTGGCIVQIGGYLFVSRSHFSANRNPGGSGACLQVTSCSVFVEQAVMEGNTASQGGAVSAQAQSTVVLLNSFVAGNVADLNGGAVFLDASSILNASTTGLGVCAFTNNVAMSGGGGLAFSLATDPNAIGIAAQCSLQTILLSMV
jgi:hypothetical protein